MQVPRCASIGERAAKWDLELLDKGRFLRALGAVCFCQVGDFQCAVYLDLSYLET